MPGLHSRLGYSLRLLVRCEWDKIRKNVDFHTYVRELSITRQDIWDILVSFDSRNWFSFETRREQVESVEDETNVPFALSFWSCLMLPQQECRPGIKYCAALACCNITLTAPSRILRFLHHSNPESAHIWTHFSQHLWKFFWCGFHYYSSFNSNDIIIIFFLKISGTLFLSFISKFAHSLFNFISFLKFS